MYLAEDVMTLFDIVWKNIDKLLARIEIGFEVIFFNCSSGDGFDYKKSVKKK